MKKLLTIIVLLCGLNLVSQIETKQKNNFIKIGEAKSGMSMISSLSYSADEENNITYFIAINNIEYTHITDIKSASFTGKQTLDDLYKIFKSAFSDENKKNKDFGVDFKLGDKDCRARNLRTMGVTSLVFYIESGSCYLTEKQVEKLFGKD